MSSKKTKKQESFVRHLVRGIIGAIILIILLVIWLIWDNVIYHWFYNSIAPAANDNGGDPLLMFWLLILFPVLACGAALLISGGYQAYKIAVPQKAEE